MLQKQRTDTCNHHIQISLHYVLTETKAPFGSLVDSSHHPLCSCIRLLVYCIEVAPLVLVRNFRTYALWQIQMSDCEQSMIANMEILKKRHSVVAEGMFHSYFETTKQQTAVGCYSCQLPLCKHTSLRA